MAWGGAGVKKTGPAAVAARQSGAGTEFAAKKAEPIHRKGAFDRMFEMNRFYEQATAMADTLRADRRALHGMPELGMELPRTTAYVEQRLRQMGLEPTRLGGGLTVCIGPQKGPVFLLRGDMDALKMQEAAVWSFAATASAPTPAAMTCTPPCCWGRRLF